MADFMVANRNMLQQLQMPRSSERLQISWLQITIYCLVYQLLLTERNEVSVANLPTNPIPIPKMSPTPIGIDDHRGVVLGATGAFVDIIWQGFVFSAANESACWLAARPATLTKMADFMVANRNKLSTLQI